VQNLSEKKPKIEKPEVKVEKEKEKPIVESGPVVYAVEGSCFLFTWLCAWKIVVTLSRLLNFTPY